MTIFDGELDTSVAFVVPRNGKIVRSEDIAKTTARRATEEERWRYGVELRITGSRWRPQTRAPHYPTPEPYVYRRKVYPLTWAPYRVDHHYPIEREYEDWLIARDKAAAQPEAPKDDDLSGAGDQARPRADKRGTESRHGAHQDRGAGRRGDSRPVAAPAEAPRMTEKPTADVIRLVASMPAREVVALRSAAKRHGLPLDEGRLAALSSVHDALAERKAAAAQLLREIAGEYGPRRAHKLRAMADWLTAPAAETKRSIELPA